MMLVAVALVMAAMMVPATPAFAIPGDNLPPGEGPSENAIGGLTTAASETNNGAGKVKVSDILITKLLERVAV